MHDGGVDAIHAAAEHLAVADVNADVTGLDHHVPGLGIAMYLVTAAIS